MELFQKIFKQILPILILTLAGSYLTICVFIKLFQTRLIFFPNAALESMPKDFNLDYEEIFLPTSKGKVHGWWIPANSKNAPVLLYLHGNASNIGDLVYEAEIFNRMGISVLLIDYRGYGLSTGPFPNETRVYEDAQTAWNYLVSDRQVLPKNIFIYGHSLGGAVAIDLAVKHPEMGGVIVNGTFTSIKATIDYIGAYKILPVNLILTQRFDSLSKVRSLQTPILYIHGTEDETVPVEMSKELYKITPSPKQLLLIPDAGHNNTLELGEMLYLETIKEFIYKGINSSKE